MRARYAGLALIVAAMWPAVAWAQAPLTLGEAMARARRATPEARALDAAAGEAEARVAQAQAGYFPRVDLVESVQRSNQPVFVFSSLLSQRRFSSSNFAIDGLNRPQPITNVRTGLVVQQALFDSGQRLSVRGARLGRELADAARAGAGQDLALAAAAAFIRALEADAGVRASHAAVEAAESDVQRARARREAGLVTDADVLAADVYLADMRQRRIALEADRVVARLELNAAIGAPLDEVAVLVPPAVPPPAATGQLVADARRLRAEHRQAELKTELAAATLDAAKAAFLPRVAVEGGVEGNGTGVADQRASWMVGALVQLNLFRGRGDVARVTEARHARTRAEAERARLERQIEVEVRTAIARLEAARAREAVGRAALAQATESRRIVRDRYDAGLATITDLLRAAETVSDAEARATSAELNAILEAVALDRAVGRL